MTLLEVIREQLDFNKVKSQDAVDMLNSIAVVEYPLSAEGIERATKIDHVVAIGYGVGFPEVLDVFQTLPIRHFVQTNRENFFTDLLASAYMLKSPNRFMKNPFQFFLADFKNDLSGVSKNRTLTLALQSGKDREIIASLADKFLKDHPKTKNFRESVLLILDEMIFNAFYNAPVDQNGVRLYDPTRDFDKGIILPKNRQGRIFISHDNKNLLVGCEDGWGSISEREFLHSLISAYAPKERGRSDQIKGLGSRLIVDNCNGLYVAAEKNVKTLICTSLTLGIGRVQAAATPKSLHLCFF